MHAAEGAGLKARVFRDAPPPTTLGASTLNNPKISTPFAVCNEAAVEFSSLEYTNLS
jgi:hypothetical protein